MCRIDAGGHRNAPPDFQKMDEPVRLEIFSGVFGRLKHKEVKAFQHITVIQKSCRFAHTTGFHRVQAQCFYCNLKHFFQLHLRGQLCLFLFVGFELFIQVAFAVALHLGLVFVFAKHTGNIFLIDLEVDQDYHLSERLKQDSQCSRKHKKTHWSTFLMKQSYGKNQ